MAQTEQDQMISTVIIAGSQSVTLTVDDIDKALHALDPSGLLWVPSEWSAIVCGMARGADLSGKAWAEAKGKEVIRVPIRQEHVLEWGEEARAEDAQP